MVVLGCGGGGAGGSAPATPAIAPQQPAAIVAATSAFAVDLDLTERQRTREATARQPHASSSGTRCSAVVNDPWCAMSDDSSGSTVRRTTAAHPRAAPMTAPI